MTAQDIFNLEAAVPAVCYTKTDNRFNPCWTCHTSSIPPNDANDYDLQSSYSFSDFGTQNRWRNLFVDRSSKRAAISDRWIQDWVAQDNFTPWRHRSPEHVAFDLSQGADEDGFARDGSGFRALRYIPFPGLFWPSNGAVDEVWIRLPAMFRQTPKGEEDREIYKINLAILEAALVADPRIKEAADLRREIEPVNESRVNVDLDADGHLRADTSKVHGLPRQFVGAASSIPVRRYTYPAGTEFVHPVYYLDPRQPEYRARRLREWRYSIKTRELDDWAIQRAYERENHERQEGRTPLWRGDVTTGFENHFGWRLRGWIEDQDGELRLQTAEEHHACLGCHSHLGVTIDQTFALPRKVPGKSGWKRQSLTGLYDRPQVGHSLGEVKTWIQRAGAGDPLRTNFEVLDMVKTQPKDTPLDLSKILYPGVTRAWELNRDTVVIVREQSFHLGRDPLLSPAAHVHTSLSTDQQAFTDPSLTHRDGRLHLDWTRTDHPTPDSRPAKN